MKITTAIPLFLLLTLTFGYGQEATTWQNWIGGPRQDAAEAMITTADGGYLLVGTSQSVGKGKEKVKKEVIKQKKKDILVTKLDSAGQVVWVRTLGSEQDQSGIDICAAGENTFFVVGMQEVVPTSFTPANTDMVLAQIDGEGEILWSKVYAGAGYDRIHSITPTFDGNFLLTGTTESLNPTGIREESRLWIALVNANGIFQWSKSIGGGGKYYGIRALQQPGGGCVVAGYLHLTGADANEALMLRMDERGNLSWLWKYSDVLDLKVTDLMMRPDGSFLLSGNTRRFNGAGIGDPFLLSLDERGKPEWNKVYSGPAFDEGDGLFPTSDGGVLIFGKSRSFSLGMTDGFAFKVDERGKLQWARAYGGRERETITGVVEKADGSWMFAGKTETYGEGIHEIYLLAADSVGNTGCISEVCPVKMKELEGLKRQAILLAPNAGKLAERGKLEWGVSGLPSGEVCRPRRKRR